MSLLFDGLDPSDDAGPSGDGRLFTKDSQISVAISALVRSSSLPSATESPWLLSPPVNSYHPIPHRATDTPHPPLNHTTTVYAHYLCNTALGMDVTQLLAKEPTTNAIGIIGGSDHHRAIHPYSTRRGSITESTMYQGASVPRHLDSYDGSTRVAAPASSIASTIAQGASKQVTFHLLGTRRALRVNISLNEDTSKIIQTLKNYFGLYRTDEVGFEDHSGAPIAGHYDNWPHNGRVYLKVTHHPEPVNDDPASLNASVSPIKPQLDAPFQMSPPPMQTFRPGSRPDAMRGASPATSIRNSILRGQTNPAGLSIMTDVNREYDQNAVYSDSDTGSISSSRRARSDHLANADISTENIVVGSTRRLPQVNKFESSELPLFKPPQAPITASISSASPQRRLISGFGASPLPPHTFDNAQQLLSPKSYGGYSESQSFGINSYNPSVVRGTRSARTSGPRLSGGSTSGLLPTPAPTVGSMISDEDVAYQLMRLGDPSNYSTRDRTSTSTMADDALSGKADLASSVDYNESEDEPDARHAAHPRYKKRRLENGGAADESSADERDVRAKESRHVKSSKAHSTHSHKDKKRAMSSEKSKAKSNGASSVPRSLPPHSRKASMSSVAPEGSLLGDDEEDLSSKPRCQRCRKSKKGCDRQRPCQRCKDAGIDADGCVSEDEGNGRKGRFGRHMGVAIKKNDIPAPGVVMDHEHYRSSTQTSSTNPEHVTVDKNKKRKR